MLFSNKLDYMLYLILKKDKKNREKIINILNKMPNEMYIEIQKILNKYEDIKLNGAIEEHSTKTYIDSDYDTVSANYSIPFKELNIKFSNINKGIDTMIQLQENKGILYDKGLFITYEMDGSNFIKYNLSPRKKFIIPIVKPCYKYNQSDELSLIYINKKFNK